MAYRVKELPERGASIVHLSRKGECPDDNTATCLLRVTVKGRFAAAVQKETTLPVMKCRHSGRSRQVKVPCITHESLSTASANRTFFSEKNARAIALISSPGAGKTSLLMATLKTLNRHIPFYVIEGDPYTSSDALLIRATGTPVVQINTGRHCGLNAGMVADALNHLDPASGSIVFIENVGSLSCPRSMDLGEHESVVLLSVAEGADKPLKHPQLFVAATLLIITKSDLLSHVEFDVLECMENALMVNPQLDIIILSALHGEGLDSWYDWLDKRHE